LVVL
jgi:hypothetical protein